MVSPDIQAIALDLDGTLLNSQNRVSLAHRDMIRQLINQNILVILASGRPYQSIQPISQFLGCNGPIISANGAVIASNDGSILNAHYMETHHIRLILEYAKSSSYPISLYTEKGVHTNSKELVHVHGNLEGLKATYNLNPESIKDPIVKIIYSDSPTRILNAYNDLSSTYGKVLHITQSDDIFLDIMHKNASKGLALEWIMKKFKLNPKKVMAFGNSYNDISMFKTAGISVAMENAPDLVKNEASNLALSNDEDGISKFLCAINIINPHKKP